MYNTPMDLTFFLSKQLNIPVYFRQQAQKHDEYAVIDVLSNSMSTADNKVHYYEQNFQLTFVTKNSNDVMKINSKMVELFRANFTLTDEPDDIYFNTIYEFKAKIGSW